MRLQVNTSLGIVHSFELSTKHRGLSELLYKHLFFLEGAPVRNNHSFFINQMFVVEGDIFDKGKIGIQVHD